MRQIMFTCLVILSWLPVSGQQLDDSFVNYTFDEGLSSSNVTCLAEDREGFVWVGTEEGLNRFDGINFKYFLKDDGDQAIAGNYITKIHVLPDNRLIIGTKRAGLCVYDPATENFTTVSAPDEAGRFAFKYVYDILPLSDEEFIISYQSQSPYTGGLTKLTLSDYSQKQFLPEITRATSLLVDRVNPKVLWICTKSLSRVDLETEEITSFPYDNRISERGSFFQQIDWVGDNIWISSWGNGIIEFNPNSGKYVTELIYDRTNNKDANRNAVRKFTPDGEGGYWVNTADKGFGHLDMADTSFAFYKHDPSRANSIFHISSRDLLIDSRGLIWIAMAEGLSLKSEYVYQINYHRLGYMDEVTNKRLFEYQQVEEIGDAWIISSTSGNGFYKLDKETKEIIGKVGTKTALGRGISGNALHRTDNGRLFTQFKGRLYEIDPNGEEAWPVVDLYASLKLDGMAASVNTFIQNGNEVWVGSDNNLIGRLQLESGRFDYWWVEGDGPYSPNNLIYELGVERNGDLWIAASQGVYRFREGVFIHLKDLSPEYAAVSEMNLESLVVTGDNVVFGAMEQGLYVYNTGNGSLRKFGRNEGLPNMRVAEMEVDTKGRVWGITAAGMFSLDLDKEDPISVYDRSDGLVATDLIRKEISAIRTGEVIVGSGLGFCYFQPDDLRPQPIPEKLIISHCRVNGQYLPGFQFEQLSLKHDDQLELGFQALGFVKPERYQYYYRTSAEQPWSAMQSQTINFNSFPDGDLTLELIAANESGEMMKEPMAIQLDIRLPVWRRAWFYLVLVALLLVIIYAIYRARIGRIRKEEALKTSYRQKLAEVEMSALRAQMNPHFLFNCLNSIKFFIINKETDQASDYLTKFSRLIRLILTNSKAELIPLSSELEALKLYVDLESLRFDQQFTFEMKVDSSLQTEFIEIPPMIIQPFVENAIWHGLLHKEGEGHLLVDVASAENELICTIEDDGIGRAKAAALKSKSATREKSMGMDITLNRLTRMEGFSAAGSELVIEDLFDNDGNAEGTRVTIRIPMN